jgi:predicted HicB family RNase H-like nuclease
VRATQKESPSRKRGRPRKLEAHKALSCRIPLDLYLALRHYSVDRGVSLNDLVIEALQNYWAHLPERKSYEALLTKLLSGGA